MEPFDTEGNNPTLQREGKQPDLKLFSFRGQFEDDNHVMFDYFIKGWYEEEGSGIRIIEHAFMHKTTNNSPTFRENYGAAKIGPNTLYWELAREIQAYLKITGTVHFDQKLEI